MKIFQIKTVETFAFTYEVEASDLELAVAKIHDGDVDPKGDGDVMTVEVVDSEELRSED